MPVNLIGRVIMRGLTMMMKPSTYTLTRSVVSVDEGATFSINLNTTNVPDGTVIVYSISGVTSEDIAGASLFGAFTVTNGTASAEFTVTADAITEGTETFTLTLAQGRGSISVSINDTSLTPTYSLSRSVASVDEGGSFTVTLTTTGLADGTDVPYTITGVTSADIAGAALTDNFLIYSGTATKTVNVTADESTEGAETFTLSLDGGLGSISVAFNDTSIYIRPMYIAGAFTVSDPGYTLVSGAISVNLDGSTDTGFATSSISSYGNIYSFAAQSDGKLLVGGNFNSYNGVSCNSLVRLNIDGTVDTSVDYLPNGDSDIFAIAVQPDGKIIIGGNFFEYYGTSVQNIVRINLDGTLDTGFNTGTGFDYHVQSVVIQPDGKILVGGDFTSYNGAPGTRIIRLNTDGSRDTGFNMGIGTNEPVTTIAVQPDGKILVGGYFTTYNGTPGNRIIRLNTDGSRDTGFNTGTGFDGQVSAIAIQVDGKIIVGGYFTTYNGTPGNRIIRLNTDGSRDTGFNTGVGFNGLVTTIAVQSDGKIIVGGEFTTYNGTPGNRIIRLNTDGSRDTGFNTGVGFNNRVSTIAIRANGKILAGGRFTSYNGVNRRHIAKVDGTGRYDQSFDMSTGFDNYVTAVAVQPDGKILAGGFFTSYNYIASNRIIRLNTNSTIDTSFVVGTGFNNRVSAIAVQPDGKILVGGYFTTYNGTPSNRIIRLNTDGSIDTGFNIGTAFSDLVTSIAVQTDGKILVGGSFTTYNGTASNRIIRLNSNGSRDNGFNIGTGFSAEVRVITVQPDGKILVGGNFTTYNGTASNRIIRLNTDGSRDNGFNTGTGFDSLVTSIAVQSGGKILAGGFFTTYNGTASNRIIQLNTDGSRDNGFNTGTGFDNYVTAVVVQSDGKILVGGNFTSYNGINRRYLARLGINGAIDTGYSFDIDTLVYAIA